MIEGDNMPSTEKLRAKLLEKLKELFQLDQPDLDFGFYRIMQVKAKQVQNFIEADLLQIIEDSFGQIESDRLVALHEAYQSAIKTAKEFGAPNPEETDGVKKAKAAVDAYKDSASAEAEVYDHLFRFFERYYDNGDFISRRYYSRENAGMAAPYAIPYNGEEVKLHWANADQYYIKTAEYFSNYNFDITRAAEIRRMSDEEKILNHIPTEPLKVHFRIVDASEGEHGNIKASDDKKRFFVLHDEDPIEFNESQELVINFEYMELPGGKNSVDGDTEINLKDLYGKSLNKGDMPNLAIANKVIEALGKNDNSADYLTALKLPAPTDKIPNRPLLAKYINQYTARNTCDYFIHKDLEGFLKRELDFYIKNEVMHLDDIENADAPAVESYLAKLKVIRKIANQLIDFLAQLENFQKKLWLKKKFVTETNYCITLDRVPEGLYPEIAINDTQREEWIKLFAFDEIKSDDSDLFGDGKPGYSEPLTIEFLKANDKLMLDTAFFSDEFKAKLSESIEDFDEQCDGVLINSENFQGLNFIQNRYKKQIECVYADPPYNAKSSEIIYKNEFKHSSWLSLMADRIKIASEMKTMDGALMTAIDENEFDNLSKLLKNIYQRWEHACISIIHNPAGVQGNNFSYSHEYCIYSFEKLKGIIGKTKRAEDSEEAFRDWGGTSARTLAKNCFYSIQVQNGEIVGFGDVCDDSFHPNSSNVIENGITYVYPISEEGEERKWVFSRNTVEDIQDELNVRERNGLVVITRTKTLTSHKTVWYGEEYYANIYGSKLLNNIIGSKKFDFPKSIFTAQKCLQAVESFKKKNSICLDYFAGSGTTGHAAININRADGGKRKYVLIELGHHFDDVLKPRIMKVVYSENWKNGKPQNRDTGVSHCFKYLRLESYEDTLNNLVFDNDPTRVRAIKGNESLHQDYMLHYLLDVETRGSQSLLNIEAFSDPTKYTLKVKKPGSDEQVERYVDMIESFNYLIGLRLVHMAAPQAFSANFIRKPDPELPYDQNTKLEVNGRILQNEDGVWWFRKIEGWVPTDPMNPNDGQKEKVLIVWRKLTGNLEEDNLMLDEWFKKYHISTRDFEYDTIYVNGSNNLPNLRQDDENWKVRLIEEEFHKKMWDVES